MTDSTALELPANFEIHETTVPGIKRFVDTNNPNTAENVAAWRNAALEDLRGLKSRQFICMVNGGIGPTLMLVRALRAEREVITAGDLTLGVSYTEGNKKAFKSEPIPKAKTHISFSDDVADSNKTGEYVAKEVKETAPDSVLLTHILSQKIGTAGGESTFDGITFTVPGQWITAGYFMNGGIVKSEFIDPNDAIILIKELHLESLLLDHIDVDHAELLAAIFQTLERHSQNILFKEEAEFDTIQFHRPDLLRNYFGLITEGVDLTALLQSPEFRIALQLELIKIPKDGVEKESIAQFKLEKARELFNEYFALHNSVEH